MPLKVTRVNSNLGGGKAGVQSGWVFTKIGDKSLDGLEYVQAIDILKKAMEPLPAAAGLETSMIGTIHAGS